MDGCPDCRTFVGPGNSPGVGGTNTQGAVSVSIGYTEIGPNYNHAFILVRSADGKKTFVIRGGPSKNGPSSGVTGGSTEASGDVGFGNLVVTTEAWAPGNREYNDYQKSGSAMKLIISTPTNSQVEYNKTVTTLINFGRKVNASNIAYRPTSTNSNAFAHQAVTALGVNRPNALVWSPGNDTELKIK